MSTSPGSIMVRQVHGSNRWSLYWTEDWVKIATFPSEFQAYMAKKFIISTK